MIKIAYQASHEQFSPSHLLKLARMAEEAGFAAINSSDHFYPWSARQGHSGHAFAWLGAAMQATRMPFSSVCAPGQRYHPAIIAQAVATLAEMFPGRYHVNLGSGEAINECITGESWPCKQERNQRLQESVDIIRRLLDGETVTCNGMVRVREAKLYTLPDLKPKLFCAALSKETAAWAATWADGLVTAWQPAVQLRELVEAFRARGGANKPMHVKLDVSYARTEAEALQGAYDQWRTNIFGSTVMSDTVSVAQFDELAKFVRPEDLRQQVLVTADMAALANALRHAAELGFELAILHNVNRDQETFIRDCSTSLFP